MRQRYYHFMWKLYKKSSDKYFSKFGVDNILMFLMMRQNHYFNKWIDTQKNFHN